MNERQLSGLPLDLPRRPGQGSADGSARAVLGVQWRNLHPGPVGPGHAHRWERALRDQWIRRSAARASAANSEPELGRADPFGAAQHTSGAAGPSRRCHAGRGSAAPNRSAIDFQTSCRAGRAASANRDRDASVTG
jgi:hypothetical protein